MTSTSGSSSSSPSSSESESDPPEHTNRNITPRIQQLVKDLIRYKAGSDSRQLRARLLPYHNAGRWIPVGVDPFVRVKDILFTGVYFRIGPTGDNPQNASLQSKSAEDVASDLEIFDRIAALFPDFLNILTECTQHRSAIRLLFKYLNNKARVARSDDSKSLKKEIITYMVIDDEDLLLAPARGGKKSSARGWWNTLCAQLLCPRSLLEKFERDSEDFMLQVRSGEIRITAKDWPTFLYPKHIKYDPHNKDFGLLRGELVIRTLRHIITSPATAMDPGRIRLKGSRSKSERNRITSVDCFMIAYAVVQVYFSLSSCSSWTKRIDNFKLNSFYKKIVTLLEDVQDPWVKETMAWFDEQLRFKELRKVQETGESDTESDRSEDELQEILYTRLAREHEARSNAQPELLNNSEDDEQDRARKQNNAQPELPNDSEDDEQDLRRRVRKQEARRNAQPELPNDSEDDEQDLQPDPSLLADSGDDEQGAGGNPRDGDHCMGTEDSGDDERNAGNRLEDEGGFSHSTNTGGNAITQTQLNFRPNNAMQFHPTNNIFAARNTTDPNASNNNYFASNGFSFSGFHYGHRNSNHGGSTRPFWNDNTFQNTTNIRNTSTTNRRPISTTTKNQNHMPAPPNAHAQKSTAPQPVANDTPLSPLSDLGDEPSVATRKRKRNSKAPPVTTDRKTRSAKKRA